MGGWSMKVLSVDLASGEVKALPLSKDRATAAIGGTCLAAEYLYERVRGPCDPLAPENPVVIMTGPLTGTGIASTGRFCLATLSPLTSCFLQSHAGGHVGPELKYAGYDGLVITGAAEEPVYLSIEDDHVDIVPAGDIWGDTVSRAVRKLEERADPEAKSLVIGPAGERLVPLACVQSDVYRACGRGGAGAVFGSKRLKAVVIRGTGGVDVHDPEAMVGIMSETRAMARKDLNGFSRYGTANAGTLTNAAGVLPTANFTRGTYEHMGDIVGSSLKETVWKGRRACFACPIGCSQFSVSQGVRTEGPEYETTFSLGSCVLNHDPAVLVEANALCNDLGLDTMSAGVTIAWAMEASERGLLPERIPWGDKTAICRLLREMAYGDGLGADLAFGSRFASRRYGGESFAMQVKGMELPGYDPRKTQGMALAYATSTRGACHLRAPLYIAEAFTKRSPALTLEGKPEQVMETEHHMLVLDSLIICRFATRSTLRGTLPDLTGLLASVTGITYSVPELVHAAERAWNISRLLNLSQGVGHEEDTLPERIFSEPLDGVSLDRRDFSSAMAAYYRARGWDERGIPTPGTLRRLGLSLHPP
ncbi:MAG: aldehyde ferredoxin oxidoreductase family protein [Candidatus Methanofastidiosa archaeon]|nr:aldehyde ferredoxin oxidoreductase family protein [Candidatus Methanofastidiosa archaeon]